MRWWIISCLFSLEVVKNATDKDSTLELVKKLITGVRVDLENELVKPYVGVKNELSISSEGLILKSNQIVVPKELQLLVIQIGHESHQCAEKTKQLMNRFIWFPGMNAAIDRFVKSCKIVK